MPDGFEHYVDANMWHPHALDPVVSLSHNNIWLDIWRPLTCKELNCGDLCCFRTKEGTITAPAMTIASLWVAIFSEEGYRRYQCSPLIGIFSAKITDEKVAMSTNASSIAATDIDPIAPSQLRVAMTFEPEKPEELKWLLWDYSTANPPREASYNESLGPNTLLFQDRSDDKSKVAIFKPKRTYNAFRLRATIANSSLLECFNVASKYKAYFFEFLPLEKATAEKFRAEVYDAILQQYDGTIPAEIQNELTRAAIELGYINIDNELQSTI